VKPNVFLVATIEGIKPEGAFDASDQIADHFADKDEPFDNYFKDLMFGAFPSAVGAASL
jgi:hypothetical protein